MLESNRKQVLHSTFPELQYQPFNQILKNKEKVKVKYTDQNDRLEDSYEMQ